MNQREIRRERFAQFMSSGLSAVESYKKAGYRGGKNDAEISSLASILSKKVDRRVRELIGANPEAIKPKTQVILEKAIDQFRRDVPWCREQLHKLINDGDCPHNVKLGAIKECLTRGLGLPIQYVEENVNIRYQISDRELTDEEWARKYNANAFGPGTTEH